MSVCVTNEIGRLQKVLLKRPGVELEHLSPSTMEELLFDDIPYLLGAQREHDSFAKILQEHGAEVVYLDDLIIQTLSENPALKAPFIEDLIQQAGRNAMGYRTELFHYFHNLQDIRTLVLKSMSGVTYDELNGKKESLAALTQAPERFIIQPMPNLYFTRDPFACIGKGVSLNRMYTRTRNRETIFGKYILTYHSDFAEKTPFYYTPDHDFSIEGGDILNLSENILAVGISQRTQAEAIELLARNIFSDENARINTVLAFDIPRARAFMHLDTVFTQVDRDKFTIHPGILDTLRVFELRADRDGVKASEKTGSLEDILKSYLHLDRVTLIPCGGNNRVAAAREQWNDGSNTLCLAPGTVVVYDRNYVTNQMLEDAGISVLRFSSAELSRGRGGPRCMSMPLIRGRI